MTRKAILSAPMLLEEGNFTAKVISLDEARAWAVDAENFCGHQTVKAIGVDPTETRGVCQGYDEALALKPKGRLEFGKEYTIEEILEIGVTPFLITRV
ncbi:hypothetical protein C0583_05685 [Candidatus Parcubacteria bacterium]|nr:MAG: hypothetical protein C0583_05685 [Candidatus Parcubacteria bacterium]